MKTLKILFRLTKEIKTLTPIIFLTIIFGIFGFISSMMLPIFGALFILEELSLISLLSRGIYIVILISAGVLRGVFRYLEHLTGHYVAFKVLAIYRDKMFDKMRHLAPGTLDLMNNADLMMMVTGDIETLEVFYAHTIAPFSIGVILSVLMVLVTGVFINLVLALILFTAYLYLGFIVPFLFHRKTQEAGKDYRTNLNDYTGEFLDSINGIKDIIMYNNVKKHKRKIEIKAKKTLYVTKKLHKRQGLNQELIDLSLRLSMVILLASGFLAYAYAHINLLQLVLMMSISLSTFGPVIAIAHLPNNLNQTITSGERIIKLLDTDPVVNETISNVLPKEYQTVMNDVSFSYTLNVPILKRISLDIKKPGIIGVFGDSGIGKSTLIKLLMYFYEADQGEITYDDFNIKSIDTKSLRNKIGYIQQKTYIFRQSVKENIDLNNEYTLEEVKEASQKAQLHETIQTFSDQYDTLLGMNNRNLSSGEKQRLSIARVLLKNPKLVLLDEPTSNLDGYNENIILNQIKEISEHHPVVIVTHKQNILGICDQVYKIVEGQLQAL